MEKDQKRPPTYITENDKSACLMLGKYLMESAEWKGLSTKEIMEVNKLLMWYNTLPQKLEDNTIEPTAFVQAEEPKKASAKKKTTKKR